MEYEISDKLKNVHGSAIREIFDLLKKGDIISFAGGMPSTPTLPSKQIDGILQNLISKYGVIECLQYESTQGKASLLEQLKKFLLEYKDIHAESQNMIVLSGGQQGIEFMCKTFINKGDTVLVENPTYLSALQIIETYEGKAVGVDSNNDGLDLTDLEKKIKEHKPKFLYVVPTFSNPTGGTYTPENRQKITEITAKYGVMILEDDPYSEIRFEGAVVPPIKCFDKIGNVVYLASFSKIIAPALRVAVAVANPTVIGRFIIAKQSTDVCSPSVNQLIVEEFLKNNLSEHLKNIIPIYKEKCSQMVKCIEKYFPKSFKYQVPCGGLFVWGYFDKECDLLATFKEVVNLGVAYLPGSHFFPDGSGKNTMRLNFSNATLEQIEKGIKILGEYLTITP
ncbi:MAG: PLP-dependent aminotransferase family protein [Fibromonadaceae bacterium]|jgi:DNA-binding transcriptional MocR family regulator|nr:PLP-dependent aminotransferase family protein [Fibromonadaceae bacterium]